jgi:hypothetical protein
MPSIRFTKRVLHVGLLQSIESANNAVYLGEGVKSCSAAEFARLTSSTLILAESDIFGTKLQSIGAYDGGRNVGCPP